MEWRKQGTKLWNLLWPNLRRSPYVILPWLVIVLPFRSYLVSLHSSLTPYTHPSYPSNLHRPKADPPGGVEVRGVMDGIGKG